MKTASGLGTRYMTQVSGQLLANEKRREKIDSGHMSVRPCTTCIYLTQTCAANLANPRFLPKKTDRSPCLSSPKYVPSQSPIACPRIETRNTLCIKASSLYKFKRAGSRSSLPWSQSSDPSSRDSSSRIQSLWSTSCIAEDLGAEDGVGADTLADYSEAAAALASLTRSRTRCTVACNYLSFSNIDARSSSSLTQFPSGLLPSLIALSFESVFFHPGWSAPMAAQTC